MTRLIKDWEELSKLEPSEKYKVKIDLDYCCGWIVPIEETEETQGDNYYDHHIYLSTHTFYGKTGTPHILKEFGWDVELDNWDKNESDVK